MTPYRQRLGNDCHRTCIAMVLDMNPDDVPHFCAEVPLGEPHGTEISERSKRFENNWLLARGLVPITVPFPGETSLEQLLQQFSTVGRHVAFILGCSLGPGVNHSVVMYDGRVYDPMPGERVPGPMLDGMWWVTILATTTTPLQHTELPATTTVGQETE